MTEERRSGETTDLEDGLRDALPALVRVAAGGWLRTVGWGIRTARSLVGGAIDPASDGDRDVAGRGARPADAEPPSRPVLRERGAELLRRSADVDFDDDTHPAYARILGDLAPDEARILRLLATSGPQPSIDVRSGWLPLGIGSQLVAPGLNMIGAEAGCRHGDRVLAYLNNLYRLGLVWFSREALENVRDYQVLEAQPEVTEATRRAGRARTVRRSIHLTPFGHDFCEMCLPLDTAEFEVVAAAAEPRS